jgi:hypothetical protein
VSETAGAAPGPPSDDRWAGLSAAVDRIEQQLGQLAGGGVVANDQRLAELWDRFTLLEEKATRTATEVAELGRQAEHAVSTWPELKSELVALQAAVGRLTEMVQPVIDEGPEHVLAVLAAIQDRLDHAEQAESLGNVPLQLEMLGATTSDIRMRLEHFEGLADAAGRREALPGGQAERDQELRAALDSMAAFQAEQAEALARAMVATTREHSARIDQFDKVLAGWIEDVEGAAAKVGTSTATALAGLQSAVEALTATTRSAGANTAAAGQQGALNAMEAAMEAAIEAAMEAAIERAERATRTALATAAQDTQTAIVSAADSVQAAVARAAMEANERDAQNVMTRTTDAVRIAEAVERAAQATVDAVVAGLTEQVRTLAKAIKMAAPDPDDAVRVLRAELVGTRLALRAGARYLAEDVSTKAARRDTELRAAVEDLTHQVSSLAQSAGEGGTDVDDTFRRRLEQDLDADLDLLSQRIEALADIVGRSLEVRDDGSRDGVATDVSDRLGRLRDAAAGVSDAVRAEAQRRRDRRDDS